MFNELNLTVQVSAADWAYAQRRLTFLDAVLIRVLRDDCGAQEWFSAAELASLNLPGLPMGRDAITRRARSGKWARMRGGPSENMAYLYHVTHLPSRAFDELVRRILDLPEEEEPAGLDAVKVADLVVPEPVQRTLPENAAPPWVLPLMRLMKADPAKDLGAAWEQLPSHMPAGVRMPSVEEAAGVLIRLGLAGSG